MTQEKINWGDKFWAEYDDIPSDIIKNCLKSLRDKKFNGYPIVRGSWRRRLNWMIANSWHGPFSQKDWKMLYKLCQHYSKEDLIAFRVARRLTE